MTDTGPIVHLSTEYPRAESFHRVAVTYRRHQHLTAPLRLHIHAAMESRGVGNPLLVPYGDGAIAVELTRRAEYERTTLDMSRLRWMVGPALDAVATPTYVLEAVQPDGQRLPAYPEAVIEPGETLEDVVRRYAAARIPLDGAKANRQLVRNLIVEDMRRYVTEPGRTTFVFSRPSLVAIRVSVRQRVDHAVAQRLYPDEVRAATSTKIVPERTVLTLR